ncbi:MAG: hypothetical protein ABW048_12365 [Sphingobium sp.]
MPAPYDSVLKRVGRALAASLALLAVAAAPPAGTDPRNPTCPMAPGWGSSKPMTLATKKVDGQTVLIADGAIDNALLPRLTQALAKQPDIAELWIRSPGGLAEVGNAAGLLIRKRYPGLVTRIPAGWACFSACNFVFMGGNIRIVDKGGLFMVHMFTHVGDRAAVKDEIRQDADGAVDMIADIEQSSAMLASQDNDFLIRMGVSRKLLTDVMYQQKAVASGGDQSTRRCLTQQELRDYNVVNAE